MGDARGSAARVDAAIRVLVVDDHELLARMLADSLTEAGFRAAIATGDELVHTVEIARQFLPDVSLLDMDLGAAGDGRSLIAPLCDLGSEVILLTGSRDRAAIGQGIEWGACGVLTKEEPFGSLVDAIGVAANGDLTDADPQRLQCLSALRTERARNRERLAPFELLTPREREVLDELRRGRTAGAIAQSSFVSLSTVRSQIRSVLTKLGVSSQLAAVVLANEAGWD